MKQCNDWDDEDNDWDDDSEYAISCRLRVDGFCQNSGSEYCEFECPFNGLF